MDRADWADIQSALHYLAETHYGEGLRREAATEEAAMEGIRRAS